MHAKLQQEINFDNNQIKSREDTLKQLSSRVKAKVFLFFA